MQWEFVPSPSVLLHPNNKQAERHSHSQIGGTELLTKQGMQQVALGFSFCPVRTAYGSKTSLGSIWGNFSPPCPYALGVPTAVVPVSCKRKLAGPRDSIACLNSISALHLLIMPSFTYTYCSCPTILLRCEPWQGWAVFPSILTEQWVWLDFTTP